MKLLLLASIALCAYAIYLPNGGSNQATNRFQSWKVNPEERRERLERLGKKLGEELRNSQPSDVKERLENFRPVRTVKSDLEALSLFEVNQRVGVAPYLFHGDIHLTEEQLSLMEKSASGSSRVKRQMPIFAKRWANNTLYFYFDTTITERKKTSIRAAHAYLQAHTCINFVESRTAANRVKVINDDGCYSEAGMIGGVQDLSIGDGCESMGTTAHEFIHALGSWHTQERSDRDTYVTIDTAVIEDKNEDQFSKLPPGGDYIYTPYDYASVMHYGANDFALTKTDLAIVPKDANYIYTMGNGQLSFYDLEMVNAHYGCDDLCPASTSAKCENGGLPNPRNCATCNCPSGFGGDLCDERPSGCGKTVVATEKWQNLEFSFGDSTSQTIRDQFTLCNHWVQAPAGKQVEVKIVYNFNGQCNYGCTFNGIELKTAADPKVVNPLICCQEFNNQVYMSALNPMPIVSHNRYYYTEYIIQYRFVDGAAQPATKAVPITVKPKPTTTTTVAPKECKDTGSSFSCFILQIRGCASNPQVAQNDCSETCGYCTRRN